MDIQRLTLKCNGARDEYPYASTYEGGKENYNKGRVSLMCVSKTESDFQGGFNSAFFRGASVGERDTFVVIPIGGVSGYFDRSGNWHSFPKGR